VPPVAITLRAEQPGDRILRCCAARSSRGGGATRARVHCEKEALHAYGHVGYGWMEHAGRGRRGQWFFWPVKR
jgi:hypothetical protein